MHLAPALAADPQNTVVALTMQSTPPDTWPGIALVRYSAQRGSTPGIHPWMVDLETKTIRGEAALHAACQRHGLRIIKRLQDKDYGLRAFVFEDPDGTRIDVGQPI